jgi:hypothetical protein
MLIRNISLLSRLLVSLAKTHCVIQKAGHKREELKEEQDRPGFWRALSY